MSVSNQNLNLYAVVMAGGKGERFWPAGRASRPKQLLSLTGGKTMIEETVFRLFPLIPPERVFVITNRLYVGEIRNVLPIPPENVIGEPEGRDTAPCAALAAALVRRKDPEGTMILLPADHLIRPAKAFQETLISAAAEAQKGVLVTLGIPPVFAATGYGYLHLGESFAPGFHRVLEFREKPDAETAEQFLRTGEYRWNSGIFIWRADVISREFRRHAPDLGEKLDLWASGGDFTKDFAECRKISIDYAVMEKSDCVIAGDAPFEWNDIGSWNSLRTVLPCDKNGNAVSGNAVLMESSGNVVFSEDDTLIGVIGMKDTAVIKSGDGVLVCPLSCEQKVKQLLQMLKKEYK
ncbi:MAG: mannose-1-phosphate guanylyltransferase [Lentisphaeria bacterium]|nr:mannose-1-phosphate guanylyltransferase [Lentisphaeria bacterium]